MKSTLNSAWRCRKPFAIAWQAPRTFFVLFLSASLALTACQKEKIPGSVPEQAPPAAAVASQGNPLNKYTGLAWQTMWELQQARAASAKYQKFENAEKDGYININVVTPNMGYHYMKPSLVDGTFDYLKPEILIYNHDENGKKELVAIEYAVPLSLAKPEGFTGADDVWDGNTGFQLWLLHVWVWAYNPAGVFNPTNPDVHLH
ncbi:MAG TPA: hypothetical protein VFZ78_08875 [Flavisolibacter sp.]